MKALQLDPRTVVLFADQEHPVLMQSMLTEPGQVVRARWHQGQLMLNTDSGPRPFRPATMPFVLIRNGQVALAFCAQNSTPPVHSDVLVSRLPAPKEGADRFVDWHPRIAPAQRSLHIGTLSSLLP